MPLVVRKSNPEEHSNQILFQPQIAHADDIENQGIEFEELLNQVSLLPSQIVVGPISKTLPQKLRLYESKGSGVAYFSPEDETKKTLSKFIPDSKAARGFLTVREWMLSDANSEALHVGEDAEILSFDPGRLHWQLSGLSGARAIDPTWNDYSEINTSDSHSLDARNVAHWAEVIEGNWKNESAWLDGLLDKLEEMRHLKPDWDSYGALPPSEWALKLAGEVLRAFSNFGVEPDKVLPSVENGVGISITRGERYGFLEVLNSQEAVGVTAMNKENYEVWEVDPNKIVEAVERICAFTIE